MIFRIDLKIFLFAILFFITKQIELYAYIMIFCIIHELGHLLMGLIVKMKPEKLEIMPYGVSISFKLKIDDYNKKIKKGNLLTLKKIIVAIAGPLTNLFISFIYFYLGNNIAVYSNILIALFNLLPVYPLDGGRILEGMLHITLGREKSKKITYIISNVAIILITIFGSIAILIYKNIAIFLIIIALWGIVIKENSKYNLIKKVSLTENKTIKKQSESILNEEM